MPACEVLAALSQETRGNTPVVLLTSGAIANTVEKVRLRRAQQQATSALQASEQR
ncbi:MAG: hypothetical protein HGA45_02715 [Chloroflexales bacterium]|nr:hypothetical protein [Chloroflexales bacterium]